MNVICVCCRGSSEKPSFDREYRIQNVAVGLFHRHYRVLPGASSPEKARAVRFILERSIGLTGFQQ